MGEQYSEEEFRRLQDAAEKAARADFPNAGRDKCPDRLVLVTIAKERLPGRDPHHEHVAQCGACLADLAAIREEINRQRTRRILSWSAAAALFCVILGIAIFGALTGDRGRTTRVAQQQYRRTAVKLTDHIILRSETPQAEMRVEPVGLTPSRHELEIELPVGSEDGAYELEVASSINGPPVADGQGRATLVRNVVLLRVRVDLTPLSPGSYVMRIRRGQGGWMVVPAQILDVE